MLYVARFYSAQFKPDGKFILVTMRDVPEFVTQGKSGIDAVAMAVDGLYTAREFYLEDGRKMQEPSAAIEGEVLIPLYVESPDEELALFGTKP